MSEVQIYDVLREPIFRPTGRVSVVPYDRKYDNVRANLEIQWASVWSHKKIKFNDRKGWQHMPQDIQLGTKKVLGFFAHSDEIVEEIIDRSCLNRITIPEIQETYRFEANMEKVHSKVYNLNLENVIEDKAELEQLQHSVEHMPLVAAKAEAARRYITDTRKPAYTIVGKAATEGISFSGSFAWIDWLKFQKYDLPGTYDANEEISRDEARHVDTAFAVYAHIEDRLTPDNVQEICDDFARLEILAFDDIIPKRSLEMMSIGLMTEHIRHSAAFIAAGFGHSDLYRGTKSPFTFMNKRSLNRKTNFFEKESTDYTKLDATEDVGNLEDEDAAC